MSTSLNTKNVSISLLVTAETSAAIVYSFHEIFTCVGTMWEQLTGESSDAPQMNPRIIGSSKTPFKTTIGATLVADYTFDEDYLSDIIIVSDLILEPETNPKGHWKHEIAWLQNQYERGAVICSVCTGSLILAEAGLLDNQVATSHWSASSTFQHCYPQIQLKPERVLVPTGLEHRIITAGGSASWADLALYLIARFSSEVEARHIAKIFLFGDRKDGQLPFSAMARPKQHDDAIIAQCQLWIAKHYDTTNPVARMAKKSKLTERTFKRRFMKVTGYAPLNYVQSLRVEAAKHILETSSILIDDLAMKVGYQDSNSFRRLFKRTIGISPHQYRLRFKEIGTI